MQNPILINTPHKVVTVYGAEHISKKQMLCLVKCLTKVPEFEDNPHRVNSVVFRNDDYPIGSMATVAPHSGAITVSLPNTWRSVLKFAKKYRNVSIVAVFHQYFIQNILHEMHHLQTLGDAPIDLTGERLKEEEELAETWSLATLETLAKITDIEPDHPANSPFLGRVLIDELKLKTKWAEIQRKMLDEHVYYQKKTKSGPDVIAMSFKRFLHLASEDGGIPDHPEWSNDTVIGNMKDVDEDLIIDMTKIAGQYQAFANFQAGQAVQAAAVVQPVTPTPEVYANNLAQPAAPTAGFSPASFPVEDDFDVDAEVERRFGNSAPAVQQQVAPVAPPQPAPQPAPVIQQVATAAVPAAQHTPEQVKALMFNVFAKCYNHIFSQCGPNAQGFSNYKGVYTQAVKLTAEEMMYVKAVDCRDANGRWCPRKPTTDGEIRGLIMKEADVPYYKLYIEYAGHKVTRILLPQNPLKQVNGQYTKTALEAQAGHAIMYVKDGDTNEWKDKLVDGVWK